MGLSWGRKSAAPPVSSPARQDKCKVGEGKRERGTDAPNKRIQRAGDDLAVRGKNGRKNKAPARGYQKKRDRRMMESVEHGRKGSFNKKRGQMAPEALIGTK